MEGDGGEERQLLVDRWVVKMVKMKMVDMWAVKINNTYNNFHHYCHLHIGIVVEPCGILP